MNGNNRSDVNIFYEIQSGNCVSMLATFYNILIESKTKALVKVK